LICHQSNLPWQIDFEKTGEAISKILRQCRVLLRDGRRLLLFGGTNGSKKGIDQHGDR
jgi:hypothetical protein